MAKLLKKLFVIACLIVFVNAISVPNDKACGFIEKTLSQCHWDKNDVSFMQNSKDIGATVTFNRINVTTLLIQCYQRKTIDLKKVPKVNFEEVEKMKIEQCSLEDDFTLTKLKQNFNLTHPKIEIEIELTRAITRYALSPKLFSDFLELKSLVIKTNSFITYSRNMFKQLPELQTLSLQVDDIIALPIDMFTPLEKLETLLIVNIGKTENETKTLNFTLHMCINLQHFRLEGVKYPIQVHALLAHNLRLETVDISNNRIDLLGNRMFHMDSEILKLSLVNNSIKIIPADIFETQYDLEEVDLSHNEVSALDDNIFAKNKYLELINLSYNKLETTKRELFANLKYLTTINLEHNQLTQINFILHIGQLKSLEVLKLSHNFIQNLKGKSECKSLTSLELSHNRLKRVFVDQFWNTTVHNLTIKLTQNKLESVDFRNVDISRRNENLTKIFIHLDDEITCNCHTISFYNFLLHRLPVNSLIYDSIDVSPQKIKCIQADDEETPATVIDIDRNNLTCPLDSPHQILCPEYCHCVRRPYDMFLIIKCRNLMIVPILPPYKTLKDIKLEKILLDVSGNRITRLPSKFRDSNYNDVTEIHAARNSIDLITSENLPNSLELLDLKFNRLKYLTSDVIAIFSTLRLINLSDNPWNCSASLELISFVKTHRHISRDFNVMQCSNQQYFLEVDNGYTCNRRILLAILVIFFLVTIVASSYACRRKRELIVEWIFQNDKSHLIERVFDRMKLFDAIIIAAEHDRVFGKYITAKLIDQPNRFKTALTIKDWSPEDPIPRSVLKSLKNARRAVIVLSEYFEENEWRKWNYFNTSTRIIFVIKGKRNSIDIGISNKVIIKFSDAWFWDKLKHAMVNMNELIFEEPTNMELQPLQSVVSI